ncbi:Hsp70 family protein [Dactylosporangium salmoneum]|uniref:Uncharacterized protein n=1 Tax=Dactylosporangium salmoneum TaxID=53361 RepID=A0ABN3FR88_9ACTN
MELAVDLGTSNTVAYVRRPGGPVEPLFFDGSPLLPSAVFLDGGGRLVVGRDAVQAARSHPERFEPSPRRRIDEPAISIGADVAIEPLLGALINRVAAEAAAPVTEALLAHPASWPQPRRDVLHRAAAAAGVPRARLVPAPLAAAAAHLRRADPGPADLLVYHLGAATFDAAVVRCHPGFEVVCSTGLDGVGGQALDDAIASHLRTRGGPADLWARMDAPATAADRAARRQLWDEIRGARETLSRADTATVYVPLVESEFVLTRAELNALAAPLLQRTLDAVGAMLAGCPVPLRPFAAVLLTGGTTRMPLVSELLHRALGLPPQGFEHPELAVAAGLLDLVGAPPPAPARPAVAVPASHQPALAVTVVDLIELSTPSYTGVTLRGELHAGHGVMEHIFPADADGRLLLFPDQLSLARQSSTGTTDPLLSLPPWRVRNLGPEESRYDLDLLVEHISAPPEHWLPAFVCRCRDIVAQLAIFLDLEGTDDLIGEHSTIDQADDALRRHLLDPTARGARRRLSRLDLDQLRDDWTDLIALLDAAIHEVPS